MVEKGAAVQRGAGLLVLEAMKMENEIPAPADGIVEEIFVTAGDTVESGADLLHLLPA
jgi:biotin carboxyl carrier protein